MSSLMINFSDSERIVATVSSSNRAAKNRTTKTTEQKIVDLKNKREQLQTKMDVRLAKLEQKIARIEARINSDFNKIEKMIGSENLALLIEHNMNNSTSSVFEVEE